MTVEGLLELCQPWRPLAGAREYLLLDRPIALSNDCGRDSPISAPRESDEALMRLYRGGDQGAFRKLYARHRAPLIRFVRRTAFDSSDVEEIIQETWMAVIRGRDRSGAPAPLPPEM